MKNVVVMGGLGQVGRALASLLEKKYKVYVSDRLLSGRPDVEDVEFLHVTIPWSDRFVEQVKDEIDVYTPGVTVIHSTVPVGTTRFIGGKIAHSPVRGQHDNLKASIAKFIKYVAGLNGTGELVKRHLEGVGIRVTLFQKPEETELAKLLCLSRYLNDLAFYQTAEDLCKHFRVDPCIVQAWTRTYNDCYRKTKWVRPELDYPKGKVGGHCVMQVSKILVEQTENEWLDRNLQVFK